MQPLLVEDPSDLIRHLHFKTSLEMFEWLNQAMDRTVYKLDNIYKPNDCMEYPDFTILSLRKK